MAALFAVWGVVDSDSLKYKDTFMSGNDVLILSQGGTHTVFNITGSLSQTDITYRERHYWLLVWLVMD